MIYLYDPSDISADDLDGICVDDLDYIYVDYLLIDLFVDDLSEV